MKKLSSYIFPAFIGCLLIGGTFSCRKFVEIPPPTTEVTAATLFATDKSAIDAMVSVYADMMASPTFGSLNTTLYTGQSADELISYQATGSNLYYINSLTWGTDDFWSYIYKVIYEANAVIAGVNASNSLTPSVKQELIGEATFMRAFCHFYLVNLFGRVPYITTTNYQVNNQAGRIAIDSVYSYVIQDLLKADTLLSPSYLDAANAVTTLRVRPNREAVQAMLARTYLYRQNWSEAERWSDSVIDNTINTYRLVGLDTVFLTNSQEAIWQLQPSSKTVTNTFDGNKFVLTAAPGVSTGLYYALDSVHLVPAFENGDQRKAHWVGKINFGGSSSIQISIVNGQIVVTTVYTGGATYYYPYKYKVSQVGVAGVNGSFLKAPPPTTEYYMVLRLAEVYLIRAEARAQQGNVTGAASDLNIVRKRAGLGATAAVTQADLLTAVMHERQVELFCEWGHRWFDLKRTATAGQVLGAEKSPWNTAVDTLYPIPSTQLLQDHTINGDQNPGYQD